MGGNDHKNEAAPWTFKWAFALCPSSVTILEVFGRIWAGIGQCGKNNEREPNLPL